MDASADVMAEPTLWVIVGATGTGKSETSLALAEELTRRGRRAEIINADAMQLYRGMDIGTAKLPEAERRGIPHHLLDVLEVTEEAAVAAYQPAARAAIADIQERGAEAILVGGSGLYVSSVIYDFQFPPRDPARRAALEAEAAEQGIGVLMTRLRRVDPETAARIDPANERRVISRGHRIGRRRTRRCAAGSTADVASANSDPRPTHAERGTYRSPRYAR